MKIEYQIIKDEKLLLLKFSGNWSLNDYKHSIDEFKLKGNFNSVHKVLSDFREVISDLTTEQIKELAEIREKSIQKKYDHVRIVTNPFATALAHLYKEELHTRGFTDNYCSTVEGAVKQLNLKLNVLEVENLLNNLENKI
ncbi:MAG: hypothetical protein KQH79_07855 [Bacteroidetes bacterium]|nr:hypothetical protein [Bacteroidota bacterium]